MGALDLLLGIQILILALPKLNSGACLPPSCLLGLWGSPSISDEFAAVVHVGRECTIPLQFLCFFGGGGGGVGTRLHLGLFISFRPNSLIFLIGNCWRQLQCSFSLYIMLMFRLWLQPFINLRNFSNIFCK